LAARFCPVGDEVWNVKRDRGASAPRRGDTADMTGLAAVGGLPGPAWDPAGHAVRAGRVPLFADSSGNPRSRAGDDAYYLLGCVSGSPEVLGTLSKMLYGLKFGLVPDRDPRSWELHGVRINHRRRGYPLQLRTDPRRLAAFGAITRVICESGVVLFGVSIDNRKAFEKFGPGADIVGMAWTLMLERFEVFVRCRGTGCVGHVVSDMAGEADMRRIRALVSDSARGRNPMAGVRTPHVAGVEFVDSLDSPLVQAADTMAYTISRDINGDGRYGEMAGRLRDRMWADASGEWSGWKAV